LFGLDTNSKRPAVKLFLYPKEVRGVTGYLMSATFCVRVEWFVLSFKK